MKESVFRAYDIRGTIGKNFSLDSVYDLGLAIAYFFTVAYPHVKSIIIGNDSRIHSEAIKKELVTAFVESGFSIFDNGLSPSPLIYFALHTQPIDAGVVVTASHNGKEDNGIKINVQDHALRSDEIQLIKQFFFEKKSVQKKQPGNVKSISVHDSYVNYFIKHFAHLVGNKTAFVIDCGNGASGPIIQKLVDRMKWENVSVLYAEPDGNFPHHDPDPTHIENMKEVATYLQQGKYEWGVGIDGDADRVAIMAKSGKLLSGDLLLALFAKGELSAKRDVMVLCNVLASDIVMGELKKQGIEVVMVPVGNPIMREKMYGYCDAQFGGETSGHFFFGDRYFVFDDGIYAMMRFFELQTKKNQSIDECLAEFPVTYSSPELRVLCQDEAKENVMKLVKKYFQQYNPLCIDGVRVSFDHGWLLIRPSNTQPVISIRFESTNKEEFSRMQNDIAQALPIEVRDEFLRLYGEILK